jgi:hypothetical protein
VKRQRNPRGVSWSGRERRERQRDWQEQQRDGKNNSVFGKNSSVSGPNNGVTDAVRPVIEEKNIVFDRESSETPPTRV